MNMSNCRTQDGRGDRDMTRGIAGQQERRVMSGGRLSLRPRWHWAVVALGVLAVIALSDNGRTFASLVTDSHGRGETFSRTLRRSGVGQLAQVTAHRGFSERELLRSIERGEIAYAESLLDAGVPANMTDPRGWTPLMLAARHNHLGLVSRLCEGGADLNKRNIQGTTALMLAASNGHQEMVRLLLDRGAQVNAKASSGWTVLTYAAWKGHPTVVSELLRAGADPSVLDSQRWTPLMYAAWQGHSEAVQAFLESQKARSMSGRERKEARTLAAAQGHSAVVEVLDRAERRG
ncbi:MAG: ankyrin repeat domain-containing protein [Deltaproteobacteria bacterium]|nr:ankyrin repeat domain-containing protein [Deltaproteobacteria bacterium]